VKALKDLGQSKKAIVYVITAVVMAGVLFSGIDPDAAESFLDKLYKLAMAYLGGQGLADLGRYAGEAYASGKKALDTRKPGREVTVGELAEAAKDVTEKATDVIERVEANADSDDDEEGKGE